jgi:hypothetical protein
MAPVLWEPLTEDEGAPGPSPLGTGEGCEQSRVPHPFRALFAERVGGIAVGL